MVFCQDFEDNTASTDEKTQQQEMGKGQIGPETYFIELDDGKILIGNPDQFDGKNPWFSVKIFPTKPIHWVNQCH